MNLGFWRRLFEISAFLVSNQFIRIRLMIREGWINKETGKIGSPRIQYLII